MNSDGYFIRIALTPEMIAEADERAQKMTEIYASGEFKKHFLGFYNQQLVSEFGRVGFVKLLTIQGVEFHQDLAEWRYDNYDFLMGGKITDLKTKSRTLPVPYPEWLCGVAKAQIEKPCDYYAFANTNVQLRVVDIGGSILKERFLKIARDTKQGEIIGKGTKWPVDAKQCRYDELDSIWLCTGRENKREVSKETPQEKPQELKGQTTLGCF